MHFGHISLLTPSRFTTTSYLPPSCPFYLHQVQFVLPKYSYYQCYQFRKMVKLTEATPLNKKDSSSSTSYHVSQTHFKARTKNMILKITYQFFYAKFRIKRVTLVEEQKELLDNLLSSHFKIFIILCIQTAT